MSKKGSSACHGAHFWVLLGGPFEALGHHNPANAAFWEVFFQDVFSAHMDPSSSHDDERKIAKSRVLALRRKSRCARRDMDTHRHGAINLVKNLKRNRRRLDKTV